MTEPEPTTAEGGGMTMASDETDASMRHQRDLLGQALGRILIAAGGIRDVPLSGPELLLFAEQYAESLEADRGGTDGQAEAYSEGRWCGECRYGLVEDPPCCTGATTRVKADDGCPHDSYSGDEGPVSLLPGGWPVRWCCDGCGHIRHDDDALAALRTILGQIATMHRLPYIIVSAAETPVIYERTRRLTQPGEQG